MLRKNYKFLVGILVLFLSTGAFAQVGGKGSVYDSSVIPSKRMQQQNDFWAGTYNFPAKPRNMWELGVSGGMIAVAGDVAVKPNWGFEAHVRKALGYVFSVRLQYMNGVAEGLNWKESNNFGKNPAWNLNLPVGKRYFSPERQPNGTVLYTDHDGHVSPTLDNVYYNYKSKIQDLSLQGIINLNNILFHKQSTKISLYAGAGIGATAYNTMVNALDDAGNTYKALFNSLPAANYDNRKDILKRLRDGMDKSYETPADNEKNELPKMGKNALKGSGTVLAGIEFKLSSMINLALEDRLTFTKSDVIDGQRWQESPWGDASASSQTESINYLSLGINVNLGNKKKCVEPLWWVNPLGYAYDELRNHRFVKIPKNECPDADGDGVCDHLDREPNTPAGCPVDTHGVTRDTDGDGVPDCKDKQLITPTECQPVNADGVGKCPDPECCKNMTAAQPAPTCPCDYPSLSFKGTTTTLSAENKAMLSTVASKLKGNPTCTISVHGYPEASKASQANCQKRLDAIKIYLIEKEGISADRISISCEVGGGDKNTVDVKCN